MSDTRFDRLVVKIHEGGLTALSLGDRNGRALVVPELGGRILAVEADGQDFLWFNPDLLETPLPRNWNAGGQRTWIAPERGGADLYFEKDGWHCPPEMDPGHFRVERLASDEEIRLASEFRKAGPDGETLFRLERAIGLPGALDPVTGPLSLSNPRSHSTSFAETGPLTREKTGPFCLRVEQSVSRKGPVDRVAVGAWSILQVPVPGYAAVFLDPQRARRPLFRDDFFNPVPPPWVSGGVLPAVVRLTGDHQVKLGFPATHFGPVVVVRYMHYARESGVWLEITQRFERPSGGVYADSPGGEPAPAGDLVQLYNHFTGDAHAYAEIEAHAPAATRSGDVSKISLDLAFQWFQAEGPSGDEDFGDL